MRLAGFEIYFEDPESAKRLYRDMLGMELTGEQSAHHAQFGASPFLCVEYKGVESYPSRDKAFAQPFDHGLKAGHLDEDAAWAVLHDPEGHNVLLIQSSGG
jgi:catechol 2,3-dioxygenase-like lactoylglutathione lyase family enzyme